MADDFITGSIWDDSAKALEGLLVDDGIISGDPGQCSLEVGKRALDLYQRLETAPQDITAEDMRRLVDSEGSEIKGPAYLQHVTHTAGLFRSMVEYLGSLHPTLQLPDSDVAYAMGLTHDLNATFSRWDVGGQQSKEVDSYLLARRHGWGRMADEVAMHGDYLGFLRLLADGESLGNEGHEAAYAGMREVMQDEGSPLSYARIAEDFGGFLAGTTHLPLILLSVADWLDVGKPTFNPGTLDDDFVTRAGDVFARNHTYRILRGENPTLHGMALSLGGLQRVTGYKNMVKALVTKDEEVIERLQEQTDFFA